MNDAPDDSDGRVGGGHGADDVNDAPDDSDGGSVAVTVPMT